MKKLLLLFRKLLYPMIAIGLILVVFIKETEQIANIFYIRLITFTLLIVSLITHTYYYFILRAEKKEKKNRFYKFISTYSNYILFCLFLSYFLIYAVLKLSSKSFYYNYILLFLLGLYLGYQIAVYSFDYFKKKTNDNKE